MNLPNARIIVTNSPVAFNYRNTTCGYTEFQCKIDGTCHASLEDIHKYLRKFKITQKDYYEEYFPRIDLSTGEKIEFKSIDQYFAAYFINKINLKRYYKEHPIEARKLSIEMLEERIERKKLQKLPGEVELISSGLPSSEYFYRSIKDSILEANLVIPYDYNISQLNFERPNSVIVDTREQNALNLKGVNVIEKGLGFGDYALEGKENILAIERKSLGDFISSFVSQYDRVHREFERARKSGAYLVILVEESLQTALNFCYIPHFKKYTKIRPEVVFHNVRNLIQEFGFQFIFCDGRIKAADVALKILGLKQDVKTLDLQWLQDRAQLL